MDANYAATTQTVRLSGKEVALLQTLAAGSIRPRCAEVGAIVAAFWERGWLNICPPGERYKLSAEGHAIARQLTPITEHAPVCPHCEGTGLVPGGVS